MCWSPNTPRLDPTWCQLEKNTPDLNRGIFDPDQVGGITSKVQGSDIFLRTSNMRASVGFFSSPVINQENEYGETKRKREKDGFRDRREIERERERAAACSGH